MSTMTNALASEVTKVTTTRLWWILAIVLFGYVGAMAGGFAAVLSLPGAQVNTPDGSSPVFSPTLVYGLASALGYVIPVLYGALATTGEFRHQTLTPTFLATPSRGVSLSAKAIVLTLMGAVYGVIGLVASVGVGGLVLALTGTDPLLGDGETWAVIGRTVLAMALWGAIGTGLGALVPNQAAVIVIVLAFTQFVEPLLRAVSGFVEWTAEVAKYLPGAASDALSGASVFTMLSGGTDQQWWAGGLILVAYAVVATVLGYLTTWRRDVT